MIFRARIVEEDRLPCIQEHNRDNAISCDYYIDVRSDILLFETRISRSWKTIRNIASRTLNFYNQALDLGLAARCVG